MKRTTYSFIILFMSLLCFGGQAHARQVMFNLTQGSSAELRQSQIDFTQKVVAVLKPGLQTLELSDDYYYIYPSEGRTFEYVRDAQQNNIPITPQGYVQLRINSESSTLYVVATTPAPVELTTNIFLYEGSSALLKHYNTMSSKFEDYKTLLQGNNSVSLYEGHRYLLVPGPEHKFTSVLDSRGNAVALTDTEFGQGVEINANKTDLLSVYNVTSEGPKPMDPWMRIFYITVDDPTMIKASMSPSYTPFELKPGRNAYYFNSQADMGVYLETVNQRDFYSVTLDETPVTFDNYALIYVNEYCEIDAKYHFPEGLTHTYTLRNTEGVDGFWTRVTVDGEDYTPVNNTVTAPAGAEIALWNDNAADWCISRIELPSGRYFRGIGNDPYQMDPSKPITFFATYKDGPVSVSAHRYSSVDVEFNITRADLVKVSGGNTMSQDEIEDLQEGNNKLHASESRFLTVKIASRQQGVGFVSSVKYRTATGMPMQTATYDFNNECYTLLNLRNGAQVDIIAVDTPATYELPVTISSPSDVLFYTERSLDESTQVFLSYRNGGYKLDYPENKCTLYMVPATDNSFINAVTYKPDSESDAYNATNQRGQYYLALISRTGSLNIVSGHYADMIHKAVVYCDYPGCSLVSPELRQISLKQGYTTVDFNESENGNSAFTLRGITGGNFSAFKNGNAITVTDPAEAATSVRLKDGDVIKLYVANPKPQRSKVTFTGNIDNAEIKVDLNTPVSPTEAAAGFYVLPATLVSVTCPDTDVMTVNGDKLEPNNGTYSFSVSSDTVVNISEDTAIETIGADTIPADADIFSLSGVRVSNPTPGIYIRVAGGVASKVIIR